MQVGGTVGAFGLAWLITRAGFTPMLAVTFAVATVSVALIGQPGFSLPMLYVIVIIAGWCIVGGQPGLNALASSYYPTYLRSTGVGAGLGVGRIGALVGPLDRRCARRGTVVAATAALGGGRGAGDLDGRHRDVVVRARPVAETGGRRRKRRRSRTEGAASRFRMTDEIVELEDFALELARTAGGIAQAHFRRPITVENKGASAFDPVTNADRAIERVLRTAIVARYPDHGIVAEEEGERAGAGDYTWFIDPIDGTRAFMTGSPLWGTLIGLVRADSRRCSACWRSPCSRKCFSAARAAAGSSRRSAAIA